MKMLIKFWGVRGSIPCPGTNTVRYGGNTACIEVCFPDINRRIIIDAGSGIRELGNELMKELPVDTDILLTHTHWDHIMGFPFLYRLIFLVHVFGSMALLPMKKILWKK